MAADQCLSSFVQQAYGYLFAEESFAAVRVPSGTRLGNNDRL